MECNGAIKLGFMKFMIERKLTFFVILLFQDVVYALAHATGKTGRFTLIESWRNNERLLAPQEHPLKVSMSTTPINDPKIEMKVLALGVEKNRFTV